MKHRLIAAAIFISSTIFSQNITWQELPPMPEAVTNNAVTSATVDGVQHIFSFAGMDSTKACGQAHLRSFMYNTNTTTWTRIADLPDELGGVVAAGASTINNQIYILGGYHIRDNCSEVSSRAVHRYNPETNDYTAMANLPIAIDDHVQAVYADSLLYVITGWSNSTNVTQVQIYNPSNDEWSMGTPVPNDPEWRVFGASGSIIHNTIFYSGGASLTCDNTACFAPTNLLRRGDIDPNDPTQITWTSEQTDDAIGYRMAAVAAGSNFIWLGGSDLTYNFDGIDYNGSGGIEPNKQMSTVNLAFADRVVYEDVLPPVMDFRGVGKLDDNNFVLCGGMVENQKVSAKVYQVTVNSLVANDNQYQAINIYPNPVKNTLQISEQTAADNFSIINSAGKIVMIGKWNTQVDVSNLRAGNYLLILEKNQSATDRLPFIKL